MRLFHLLHKSHRAIFRLADKMLEEKYGISSTQHVVLLALNEKDGLPIGELATVIGLKAAATSGLVDRMEQKDLLERKRADEDRRSFIVCLKEAGKSIVQESKSMIAEANSQLLDGYSEEEQALISKFLETTIERANNAYLHAKGKTA
ncbi:MarR family transcriptional regulator [Kordiimonas sp. SCSIO 12603]|uniref:MarR family winged helix-turn-helix transcriptional regulator n=1 Tax=Kordiimonas sp. SCSIO 12603 TaxID=2829596 RepID=UPI002105E2D0|nr:MarR family transcriptional regulator [Kordiimonas sp. SCSIO 12603]UTW58060.1 MarR family transcriptional regulator [Kordiimonas sp. SCSIO 12603]